MLMDLVIHADNNLSRFPHMARIIQFVGFLSGIFSPDRDDF